MKFHKSDKNKKKKKKKRENIKALYERLKIKSCKLKGEPGVITVVLEFRSKFFRRLP